MMWCHILFIGFLLFFGGLWLRQQIEYLVHIHLEIRGFDLNLNVVSVVLLDPTKQLLAASRNETGALGRSQHRICFAASSLAICYGVCTDRERDVVVMMIMR